MKRLTPKRPDQSGFITMMVTIIAIILFVVYLVFTRVINAKA